MSEEVTRPAQGTPCWVSLMVHNLPAAQDFYGGLFGWRFRPGPQTFGSYQRAVLGDLQVGGIGELPEGRHQLPVAWTTYLCSDDADLTAELIREQCGTVAVGPLDADAAGRMAIASDPGGAVFGVWEPRENLGADVVGEPGTVAWNELITRDDTYLASFYSAVFGYTAEQTPTPYEERTTLNVGGQPVAGIISMGDEMPRGRCPYWMTYFTVAEADAAAQQVIELGGYVLGKPEDTQYGRMATVTDPEGALFTLIESPKPV